MTGFSWDWSYAASLLPRLLEGLELTIFATFAGSILALILGLVWALLRLAQIKGLSAPAGAIVAFLRGTPFIVQLFFLFYVLPLHGVSLSPLTTGVVALGLYFSSYMSEIYRAGIESIAPGQWEACLVLGLPIRRIWAGVILPQAARTVTPMLANYVIVMFKESALLSTITVMDMFGQAMDAGFARFRFIEPITLAGGLYFVISYAAAIFFRYLEGRFA